MKISSLPLSIQKLCYILRRGNLAEEEQAKIVQTVVKYTVSFLGKLVLLEYLQGNWKSTELNHRLFESGYPDHPRQWLSWSAAILDYFVHTGQRPVLYPLLNLPGKYALLQVPSSTNQDDPLSSLVHFYDLVMHGSYLLSSPQIQESVENVWNILEELQFLDTSQYHLEERQTAMIFSDRTLWLMPFFCAQLASEGTVLEIDEDGYEVLPKAYQMWLTSDFDRHCQEQKAETGAGWPAADPHRPYVVSPWLQAAWDEGMHKATFAMREMEAGNVLLVEGYPASGKTALAQNLDKLVGNAGKTLSYFVIPYTPWQKCATFRSWLTRAVSELTGLSGDPLADNGIAWQQQLMALPAPIVVAVDGVEYMPPGEYENFVDCIGKPPWSRLVFVLLKRLFEPCPVHAISRIELPWQDNVYFSETFTPDYLQNIGRRYVQSTLAQKIFAVMAPSRDFLSLGDIATRADAFTPDVMQALLKMRPLCEVDRSMVRYETSREHIPCEKYRLFHPILSRMKNKQAE